MAALGAEGRRFKSCLPDQFSTTYVNGAGEQGGNARHVSPSDGGVSHGIVPDRIGIHDFSEYAGWRQWPLEGGAYYYWDERFAAWLEREGYGPGGKQGVPQDPKKFRPQSDAQYWRARAAGMGWETYFARGDLTGRIKIGKSKEPEYRVSQLAFDRNGSERGTLLATVRGDLERAYHNVFAEWRDEGEWFAPHPDILAEIERLNPPITRKEP